MLGALCFLCCVTGSPLHNIIKTADEPYGYAPYVWISVISCNTQTGWCQGRTRTSFALAVAKNITEDRCTHYCPENIYANWRPFRDSSVTDLTKYETEGLMLGAYVNKLDKFSCLEIPGGFRCSDRVVRNTPLNKVSIMLHAKPQNRDYYFGDDPMVKCGTDPQCASFKLLKRTLYATEGTRQWPDAEEVLTIRNSPYACTLAYVGLGDAESLGSCYTQLGDNCFTSEGNRFCIGGSDKNPVGITNSDGAASAPIGICELSSKSSLEKRDPSCIPTSKEIRDFIDPSSCDATVISLDRSVYNSTQLSFDLDVAVFHTVSEAGHVIMRVPLDECLIPTSSTSSKFHSTVSNVAETLAKIRIATHSTAIMLDASEWGVTACPRKGWLNTDFTKTAEALASALVKAHANKLFLRLPGSKALVSQVDFARLQAFEAFVTPRGKADMTQKGYCQNMWTRGQGSSDGIMAYILTLLRKGVPANRIIFTLSLTGGLKIGSLESGSVSPAEIISELTLADMESNTVLRCEEDLNTKCCSGSSEAVWARNVVVNITVTSTSFETLKSFPELIAVAFGINQFVITPVDSDFRRGVRSDTPALLGITSAVHRLRDWKRQQTAAGISSVPNDSFQIRARRSLDGVVRMQDVVIATPDSAYKDPASGSKNCLDPQYIIGLSNRIVCPGLIAVHGALGVFKEAYKEMYATSYEKIYIADVYKLDSCTPGEPSRKAKVSTKPPQIAINVNTLIPTTDRNHYMVGILDSDRVVEYVPPVNKVCTAHNSGDSSHSMNVVFVDDGYTIDKPAIESQYGVIVKPVEALYFVSNFTPGIDYINLNVSCVNYDISALQPCLIAICGGDSSCRRDYGRLCDSAHEIMNDARRAGELMREGLEELGVQEKKARMYEIPDNAPFPWLDRPKGAPSRNRRFLGFLTGAAGLGLAWHVSNRVDKLENQLDELKTSFIAVSNTMVEVSNKLDTNINLVNGRIDEQEMKMKKNNDIVNSNFALLRDTMKRNTEVAMRDTNVKFSVMASYQMWYAQMQSVTHQMMQAAMHTKFMARGVENCLRQISAKRSGSCPSGMSVMQEHPGLSDFPTVGTALYKNRKFFIVHSIPGTVEKTVVRGIIPMPKMSTDGVPCWPDYNVWLIDGKYHEPSQCYGKYCHKPERHERYLRCIRDANECKTVCSPCHRGVCYAKNKITWMEGSAEVEIESPPLKPFSRPHISDGPVSFADLLKDVPGAPELDLVKAINTSVNLVDVREDLDNVTKSLEDFGKRYDAITSSRVTFGGWLSGFASDAALWTSVAVLMAWCSALSAGIAYMYFCGGGSGGGRGGVVMLPNIKRRPKLL